MQEILALRARTRVARGRLRLRLAVSRGALGDAFNGAAGLTFVRSHGQAGDQLIGRAPQPLGRRLYDEYRGQLGGRQGRPRLRRRRRRLVPAVSRRDAELFAELRRASGVSSPAFLVRRERDRRASGLLVTKAAGGRASATRMKSFGASATRGAPMTAPSISNSRRTAAAETSFDPSEPNRSLEWRDQESECRPGTGTFF